MGKKTYREYLLEQHPELASLAEYYASLGVAEPLLWAESERNGKPAVASCALAYGLRGEIAAPGDHRWAEAVLAGDVNVENEPLREDAAAAIHYLRESGVALERLTPLIRLVQTQVVRNVAALLDQGPALACLPLPAGRETGWQVVELKADGSTGQAIGGLHEILNDPDPL